METTLTNLERISEKRRRKLIRFFSEEFQVERGEAQVQLNECSWEDFTAHMDACENGYM